MENDFAEIETKERQRRLKKAKCDHIVMALCTRYWLVNSALDTYLGWLLRTQEFKV